MSGLDGKACTLSVIIPVYNEERTIAEVLRRVSEVRLTGVGREIIVSDDGSTDRSAEIIDAYAAGRTGAIRVHRSLTNLGKGAAVRLGMALASGDIILIQDADLELDPAEHPQIIEPILTGHADVVYGSRFLNRSNRAPRSSRFANWFLTVLTNVLFRARLTDMETAYKAFRRSALNRIRLRCVRFDFEPEITARLLQAGYQILEVPISYDPRRVSDGKKVSWIDGIEAVWALLRCRFTGGPRRG